MTSFDAVIAGGGDGSALYTGPDGAEQLNGAFLSGNTFNVLGIDALIGRTITPDDGKAGRAAGVRHELQALGEPVRPRPDALGQTFTLDGVPTTLIGVMPPRVSKLGADVWRPVLLDRANRRCADPVLQVPGAGSSPASRSSRPTRSSRRVAARVAKLYPRELSRSASRRRSVDSWTASSARFRKTLYTMAAAVATAAADRVRQRREHAPEPRRRPPAGAGAERRRSAPAADAAGARSSSSRA